MVKGPRKLAKPTRGGHLEMKRWWWANMHTSNYGVIKMRSKTTTRTQLWWWILERLLWRNYKSNRRKYHNIGVKYYWTFTFKCLITLTAANKILWDLTHRSTCILQSDEKLFTNILTLEDWTTFMSILHSKRSRI